MAPWTPEKRRIAQEKAAATRRATHEAWRAAHQKELDRIKAAVRRDLGLERFEDAVVKAFWEPVMILARLTGADRKLAWTVITAGRRVYGGMNPDPLTVIAAGRRGLAKRYHPDRAGGDAARMAAVNRVADALECCVKGLAA